MPIEEPLLRDALVALAVQCKQQYVELTAATDEIAALHKAMQHLDPRFAEALAQQKTLPRPIQMRAAAIERFDEIIQKLSTHAIHDL